MTSNDELVRRAAKIAMLIKPLLHGQGPEVQSAALGELVSIFLAGNHPKIRDQVWAEWTKMVLDLVPIQEAEMFLKRPKPEGWE